MFQVTKSLYRDFFASVKVCDQPSARFDVLPTLKLCLLYVLCFFRWIGFAGLVCDFFAVFDALLSDWPAIS